MTIFLGESQDLWVQVFFQTDNRLRNIFIAFFIHSDLDSTRHQFQGQHFCVT